MLLSAQPFRVALKRLARAPGFAAAAVITLAIGIGGTTFVFSVVQSLLARSLPYKAPERLVILTPTGMLKLQQWTVFEQVRDGCTVFEQIGAYAERAANMSGEGHAERVLTARVTDTLLSLVGVRPAVGRSFLAEEYQPGRGHVVLLSDALWRRRYGASPGAIGGVLVLDGQAYTIVGVLPPEFRTISELRLAREVTFDENVGLLLPVAGNPTAPDLTASDPGGSELMMVGRLRNDVLLDRARGDVAAALDRLAGSGGTPEPYALVTLNSTVAGEAPAQLAILSAAVALLLFVACLNVANLLLERVEARRREMAVRTALGATFSQVVGTVLAETVLLACAGGASGVVIAWGSVRALRVLAGPLVTHLDAVQINLTVLAFAGVLSLGTGVLIGLIPAIRLSRVDVASALHAQPVTPRRRLGVAVPSLLTIGQVAVSVLLVVLGGLLARDFVKSLTVDLGFRTRGILTAEVPLTPAKYARGAVIPFFADLVERAGRLPGVESAALVGLVPGGPLLGGTMLRVEGSTVAFSDISSISSGYFSVLGIPMIAGRGFTIHDTSGAPPVFVVNDAFARQHWGSAGQAVGQHVFWNRTPFTVVGVAADAYDTWRAAAARPKVYYSYRQGAFSTRVTLLLRGRYEDAAVLAAPLTRLVATLDPDQPLYNVLTLEHIVYAKFARPRLLVTAMMMFASLTLLLAAVGVHGVLSYAVALRTREIGVRRALGGSEYAILGLILWRGMRLIAVGVAIGLPVALALRWFGESELSGATGTDPMVCAGAVVLVAAVGLMASLVPAVRAMRIDPIETLRSE
jgi:predicted permease